MTFPEATVGRSLLALALGALLSVAPATAQQPDVLRGTVVNDGEPVPGVEVTLHRVRSQESGPVSHRTTDGSGSFTFELPPPDTTGFAVLFATAEFEGVRYFGPAVHPDDPAGGYSIEVFDSTSAVPLPIRLSRRDMMLVPQPDGGWEVDEVVRIHNPNSLTLVSSGGLPTWEFRIPDGVEAFEVGEGEIPAGQVQRMEARVLLMLPLLPGTRELYVRYRLPPDVEDAVLPFEGPADTFNLFIRQPSPTVSVTGLSSTDMITVEENRFLQYSGIDLPLDSEVGIQWESAAPPVDPILAAVGVTLLLLGVGVVAAVRSHRRAAAGGAPAERSASRDLAVGSAE